MALKDIIAEVNTILSAVAGIGKVHDYERWVADEAGFRTLFLAADGRLHGWTITREQSPARDKNVHAAERTHRIVLRGYMALKDDAASEKTFQDLVEAVFAAFLANRKLNNKAIWSAPVSVRVVQHRRFGGVLCHYAELVLDVIDYPVTF